MKSLLYLIAFLFVISVRADNPAENPCKVAGFFAIKDNSPVFYGCYANKYGGLTLKYLSCRAGEVFSSEKGFCVPIAFSNALRADSEVTKGPEFEKPTIPTLTESIRKTSASVTESTETEATKTTYVTTTKKTTVASHTNNPEIEVTSTLVTETETKTTEVAESTTESGTESTAAQTTETETTETKAPNTEITETVTPTTKYSETPDFICPTTGFFPQDNSLNQFIYCTAAFGDLRAFKLNCSGEQNFDPQREFCDINYNGDLDTTTISPTTETTDAMDPETGTTESTTETDPETSTIEASTIVTSETETTDSEVPVTQDPSTTESETEAPETIVPVTESAETTVTVTEVTETTVPVTEVTETTVTITEVTETTVPVTEVTETTVSVTEVTETTVPLTEGTETTVSVTETPVTDKPTTPTSERTDVTTTQDSSATNAKGPASSTTDKPEPEDAGKAASFSFKSYNRPSTCLFEGTFAHPMDCSKYYDCTWDKDNGKRTPKLKQCSGNQVYNIKTASCGREFITTCLGRWKNSKFFAL